MKLKFHFLIDFLSFVLVLSGCSYAPSTDKNQSINIMRAYANVLNLAPAIVGEYEELNDATFDYEQNYQKFHNHYDSFAIVDINQDNVLELIASTTINYRWTILSIFTYENEDVILLKNPHNHNFHGTIDQMSSANGAYLTYICKDNHIHSVWRGASAMGEELEENTAYALENNQLIEKECLLSETDNSIDFNEIAKINNTKNVNAILQ